MEGQSTLTDEEQTTQAVRDGREEQVPYNFMVHYGEGDNVNHLLDITQYATSHEDEPGSWCLLRCRKGKGKAKAQSTHSLGLGNGKAKATGLLPDISQMTADQRAALRAALDAADDEGE